MSSWQGGWVSQEGGIWESAPKRKLQSFYNLILEMAYHSVISLLGLSSQNTNNWVDYNRKCIVSQFWRLEVPAQHVSRAVLHPEALGEDSSCISLIFGVCQASLGFLACRCTTPVTWLSPPVCLHHCVCLFTLVSEFPLCDKDTNHIGLWSALMISF